eukprot:1587772-Lingulodinium_polyedra.AAC.1
MLQEIVQWQFTDPVMTSMDNFDTACRRYTEQSGELITDNLKVMAVMARVVVPKIREHLVLNAARLADYAAIRAEVGNIAKVSATWVSSQQPEPNSMEVDALQREDAESK